ncbi:hypothetical protein ACFE04_029754 [Oxalis oulophora]
MGSSFLSLSLLCAYLISSSHSLTCTSQNFTNNNLYTNCTDLPTLNSYLHYTYNAANSSLNIAFIATPPKSNGWISWAVNPTSTGMIGAQALIAFKSNGSLVVKKFNLTSYSKITESTALSFDVWDLNAEENVEDGSVVIFGSLKVPDGNRGELNHVWQVGSKVSDDGIPVKHQMVPANLKATAVLELVDNGSSVSPAPSTSSHGAKNGTATARNVGVLEKSSASFVLGLVLVSTTVNKFEALPFIEHMVLDLILASGNHSCDLH